MTMWDDRFSGEDYAYGTTPNAFLEQHATRLQSPVLSLADGEGRNGVYLATLGLEVSSIDSSKVGIEKARALAKANGVAIDAQFGDLSRMDLPENAYLSVVSIFAHFPVSVRTALYKKVIRTLKPGGLFLLEGYSKAQIQRDTGGPRNSELLLSLQDLESDFHGFEIIHSQEIERDVVEGVFHTGLASVVQFIARKP